jgi:hypothetical protein
MFHVYDAQDALTFVFVYLYKMLHHGCYVSCKTYFLGQVSIGPIQRSYCLQCLKHMYHLKTLKLH